MLLPIARPEEIQLDPARLAVACDLLARLTAGKRPRLPGAALVVGRYGRIVEPRLWGCQSAEAGAAPIRPDAVFLLASITKPVTCMAALLLLERGLLNLADPVVAHIPDFAANGKEDTLLLHLFTHTSGLPDQLPQNRELRRSHSPLERFVEGAIATPPLFAAGTDVRYQSMGTLVLAEVVQRLAGKSIHDFLDEEVFAPLGLTSTALGSRRLPAERIVGVRPDEAQSDGDARDFGWNSRYWRELGSPWGGLFSTPEELAVLCALALDGGRHGTVRLLSPATMRRATTNRLGDLPRLPAAVAAVRGWGLGWQMNHPGQPSSLCDLLGADAYGHTGATGTLLWIDPTRHGFCVVLTSGRLSMVRRELLAVSNVVAASFL